MSGTRVGIDLVSIRDVASSIARFGDRYEARIFTDLERADSLGTPPAKAANLAARFAAKEAAIKVLRPEQVGPPWRSVEVVRAPGGACFLRLHGEASRMAAAAGLTDWSLSLSHEGGVAAAVVAATEGSEAPKGCTG